MGEGCLAALLYYVHLVTSIIIMPLSQCALVAKYFMEECLPDTGKTCGPRLRGSYQHSTYMPERRKKCAYIGHHIMNRQFTPFSAQ